MKKLRITAEVIESLPDGGERDLGHWYTCLELETAINGDSKYDEDTLVVMTIPFLEKIYDALGIESDEDRADKWLVEQGVDVSGFASDRVEVKQPTYQSLAARRLRRKLKGLEVKKES